MKSWKKYAMKALQNGGDDGDEGDDRTSTSGKKKKIRISFEKAEDGRVLLPSEFPDSLEEKKNIIRQFMTVHYRQ